MNVNPAYTPDDLIKEKAPKIKKDPKNILSLGILIVCVLILIVNALNLFAGGFSSDSVNDGKAIKTGNLGNYNIVSKNNSVKTESDGTNILTLDLKFVNYAEKGQSFSGAVDVVAYQDNKELRRGSELVNAMDILSGEAKPAAEDESELRVRNGKSADVFLKYIVPDTSKDVEIIMTSGDYEFTYTVKLSETKKEKAAETKPADNKKAPQSTTAAKDIQMIEGAD